MRALHRWLPSLVIFAVVQVAAALWIWIELYPASVPEAIAHTLGGPLNLFLRLDRLWHYGNFPRDAILIAMMVLIAVLPWTHAWRPRRATLVVSLLGSLLWAAAGFLFTIDHM